VVMVQLTSRCQEDHAVSERTISKDQHLAAFDALQRCHHHPWFIEIAT
jgi:hypothetical protein